MDKKNLSIKNLLLGKPLKSNELGKEKLNRIWGVPIMASDAVSSVAYAIEEILMVLVPVLGMVSINYLGIVTMPIIFLLLVLAFSYSQIIDHYPNGGGAYIVSSENIGKKTSLVAASALIIDYIMTVAVSLSSATSAFLAAFPQIAEYRVIIALLCLCFITIINLRGISESSKVFGIPTYGFIIIMGIMILTGLTKIIFGKLPPINYGNMDFPTQGNTDFFLSFLLLKAFSSGCSALTGIEAVSNAVPSFKEPSQRTAKDVLYILVGIIVFIFGGSVLLAVNLRVVPVTGSTIISQMGAAVFGNGILFYILQFATSFILLLAANTAYNGLPTLLAILAEDRYLPMQFSQRGTKLSFSNGIMFIFGAAGFLLVVFNADTHHMIPLYSVGVFLSFTLSQVGMVIKWRKIKGQGWKHKCFTNSFGAVMTFIGMIIVLWTKFTGGAWMLIIAIPMLTLIMSKIKKHYDLIAEQLKVDDFVDHYHKSKSLDKNLCIVLVNSMSRSLLKSLNYANSLTSNVIALHVSTDSDRTEYLKEKWEDFEIDIPLEVLDAPYRDIIPPLEAYIEKEESKLKPGQDISVVIIKFIEIHWYDNILHNQTTYFIQRKLSNYRNVATIIVPYLYKVK